MLRDTRLVRTVVITTVAVAVTAIGVSVASSSDRTPSARRHQSVASAPTSTVPLREATTATAGSVPASDTSSTAEPTATTTAQAAPALTSGRTAPLVTAIAPVTTVPPTTAPVTSPPAIVAGGGIAIGDSVLEDVALYAPTTLTARGVVINAAVSRQWAAGESIVATLRASRSLPAVVVMALGTNGPISAADFDKMMSGLAGVRRVVFMTVTGPLIANNDVIRAGVARYPQAVLADWASLSAPNPTWFARDHVHVGAAGAAALGHLFASVI